MAQCPPPTLVLSVLPSIFQSLNGKVTLHKLSVEVEKKLSADESNNKMVVATGGWGEDGVDEALAKGEGANTEEFDWAGMPKQARVDAVKEVLSRFFYDSGLRARQRGEVAPPLEDVDGGSGTDSKRSSSAAGGASSNRSGGKGAGKAPAKNVSSRGRGTKRAGSADEGAGGTTSRSNSRRSRGTSKRARAS
jgi:hypothetical protein